MNRLNFLGLSSQGRCSSPPTNVVASSGLAPTVPCSSYAEDSRAGCRAPAGVSPGQSRGAESPPFPAAHAALGAAQDPIAFQGWECSWLGHVAFFISHHIQAFLLRASVNQFSTQLVALSGIATTQVQDLGLGLHGVCTAPPLQPVQVPLDDILSLQRVDCSTELGVGGKLAEVPLIPLCLSVMEVLNSIGPSPDPGGTPLVIGLQVDRELLTTTLSVWPYRQFSLSLEWSLLYPGHYSPSQCFPGCCSIYISPAPTRHTNSG